MEMSEHAGIIFPTLKDNILQYRQSMSMSNVVNENNLPYLNYIYDKIASIEYPDSAELLSALREKTGSGIIFYEKIINMTGPLARKELGIGEVSARGVNRICDVMRRIVNHHGTKNVFDNSDNVELFAPRIESKISQEDIRTYHAYQNLINDCHGSIVELYMWVAGCYHVKVKLPGISIKKTVDLFNIIKDLFSEIDAFLSSTNHEPYPQEEAPYQSKTQSLKNGKLSYNPFLLKYGFSEEQIERIVDFNERKGYFPLFMALSFLFNQMEERLKNIVRYGLNVVYGQPLKDLNELASAVGLSRERVRQLLGKGIDILLSYPRMIQQTDLLNECRYSLQSDYDFKQIRDEENVDFSNEYIIICTSIIDNTLSLIGDMRKSLLRASGTVRQLYLVPKDINSFFMFERFIQSIDAMVAEKRFFPYRDELETFVHRLIDKDITDEVFYSIVRECRKILLKGYPNNIINNQIFFPANARKAIPYLIEDILREFNRPMSADEICNCLNERYPNLDQKPSKIGANALRNSNIIAVSRSSTYALVEWNYTDKRGGTIRDIVEEYLNSLIEPIAPLSDICDYISIFRGKVKESSVKSNLLAESSNKYSLYYKGGVMYIGYTNYAVDESYIIQEKRQGRRSFKDSITLLEKFIQENERFPFSSGVTDEEIRLSRFFSVCKNNLRKGTLAPDEKAEIERIESMYEQFKIRKEHIRTRRAKATEHNSISWMDCLTSYVSYITQYDMLPPDISEDAIWYNDNKALYDAGKLGPDQHAAFTALIKIVKRMNK